MSYYKYISIFSCIILLGMTACNPAEPDPADVLVREQQRVDFLVSKSYDQLSAILSPTLSYTHSNASIDNKEEFMEELRSGRVTYRNLIHQDLNVRFINPTTAIINGISDVSVTVEGAEIEVPLRFTIVYVNDGGEWLLEAWHSVRRPE